MKRTLVVRTSERRALGLSLGGRAKRHSRGVRRHRRRMLAEFRRSLSPKEALGKGMEQFREKKLLREMLRFARLMGEEASCAPQNYWTCTRSLVGGTCYGQNEPGERLCGECGQLYAGEYALERWIEKPREFGEYELIDPIRIRRRGRRVRRSGQ